MKTIRLGTRGSKLALIQTEMISTALNELRPDIHTQVCIVKTKGDILSDAPLDAIGGKGVFVKDIEQKLLDKEIDIAIHSLKDMQAILPEGLIISAYVKREDPHDMIFSQGNHTIETLPNGASVGTSSMRRRCQIRFLRPDLNIVDIRGNVSTRLNKVGDSVDAVILAAAGIIRLKLPTGNPVDISSMIPSPGQGIIAVQSREDDDEINEIVAPLDHEQTHICAEAEREFLAALGRDCNLPAGAYATISEHGISIIGMLGSPDETKMEKLSMKGKDPSVGTRLAQALKERIHTEKQK